MTKDKIEDDDENASRFKLTSSTVGKYSRNPVSTCVSMFYGIEENLVFCGESNFQEPK